jgi:hypothetical protein
MRIARAGVLAALLVVATACQMDVSIRTTVAKDGSGSFSMVVSTDEELNDLARRAGQDPIAAVVPAGLEQAGWTVTRAPGSVTIAQRFRSVEDLTGALADLRARSRALSTVRISLARRKGGGRTTTTFNATYDLTANTLLARSEMSSPDRQRLQTILEQPSNDLAHIELAVHMPGRMVVRSSIPGEESGGVATWRPRLGSRGTIRASATESTASNLPLIVGPILGALALAGGLIAGRRISRRA